MMMGFRVVCLEFRCMEGEGTSPNAIYRVWVWDVRFIIVHIVRLGCRESGEHFGRERGEKKRQTETAKKLASWMPDSLSTSKYLRREGILRLCKTGVEPWRARERGERFAENINVIPTIRSTGGGQGPGVGGDQPQGSKI